MLKPNIYLFPQLDDNYGYLIKNPHATEGILVDPSDIKMCLKILELNDCKATHILLTHHHDDHIAAVQDLKNKFQSIVVGYENDKKIPEPDLKVKDEEIFEIYQNKFKVIHTPGHTLQHINYFMPDCNILFSGDTLFSIGCGRMFEGTPEVFWESLSKIKQLPEETIIYCGHEYTLSNVKFAASVDPDNASLQRRISDTAAARASKQPTVPSTMGLERATNPFLRPNSPEIRTILGMQTQPDAEVFAEIRRRKDNF